MRRDVLVFDVKITHRPIDVWPGTFTRRRKHTPFDATYTQTVTLLDRELRALTARNVVLMTAVREQDFRLDGELRANARAPEHPGIILAFESKHGPLKYATDLFCTGWHGDDNGQGWKENLRAVTLGLEALRKVDRYGISTHGEQYTGWKALPSGIAMPASTPGFASLEDACRFVATAAGDEGWTSDLMDGMLIQALYRDAAKRLHPDVGGDPEEFKRLTEAKRMLDEAFE